MNIFKIVMYVPFKLGRSMNMNPIGLGYLLPYLGRLTGDIVLSGDENLLV